jgi:cytochrome c
MTRSLTIVSLAALALALAACGPRSSKNAPSQSASEAAPPAAAPSPEAAPASQAAPMSEAAPASEGGPTSEAAETSAAPAGPAPAGMIPLQIKAAGGAPVFGNPDNGKQVFVVCSACHSIQAGQNMVGPSLHGIVNRHSGTVPGFHYSSANKNSGLVWTEQELYAYLENPQKVVPGTYMTYMGVKDPQQRADLIAYLQQAAK